MRHRCMVCDKCVTTHVALPCMHMELCQVVLSRTATSLSVSVSVSVSVSGSPCFVSIGVSIKLFFASCLSVSVDWDAKIVYATTILHMCICVRRHAVS